MILRFDSVTKKGFGKKKSSLVLSDLSFELNKGQHLSFLCNDEAKRIQLIRLILGTTLPHSGKVSRCGSISTPVGESGIFHSDMTSKENIHFICELYGRNSRVITKNIN
jgi:capsular polysaccharide transport system ATP-binding protein